MATTWSEQQKAIFGWFKTGKGNLVVRARAGTGKTTTIIEGIRHAPEPKVMLCAFNKRIATELQQKLNRPGAEAKTLHSIGFSFVRRAWNTVGVDSKGARSLRLAQKACPASAPDEVILTVANLATKAKEMAPFATHAADLMNIQVEFGLFADREWEDAGYTPEVVASYAIQAKELARERDTEIDFADMLYIPVRNGFARGWYDLVCVDEAQDMNVTQLALAQQCCRKGGRIVVVGDDRQAIYAFRGADSQSLDRLKSELHATELGLTTTYRCPRSVVALAQKLVPDYNAAPTAPEGEILDIPFQKLGEMAAEGDFVLSRTNAPLARTCMTVLKLGKRARVEGKDIGKGLVALVKKLAGKGKKSHDMKHFMMRLGDWEKSESEKWAAADRQAKAAEVHDKSETLCILAEGLTSVDELKARIEHLFADSDGNLGSQVVCSTVHKAKGLEAARVFLLVSTLYPGKNSRGNIEEQNIEYVAVTRAKQTLVQVSGV